MREQTSILTQSRFFSPAFNGAIFDGPLRIYFSQSQEAAAMKMYFAVLAQMRNVFGDIKDSVGEDRSIFILVYPTVESFNLVFPGDSRTKIQTDRLDQDHIIGLCCPLDESEFPAFFKALDQVTSQLPMNSSFAEL